jgi:hypothetical protein
MQVELLKQVAAALEVCCLIPGRVFWPITLLAYLVVQVVLSRLYATVKHYFYLLFVLFAILYRFWQRVGLTREGVV